MELFEALLEKSQLPVSELSSIYAMSDLVGETQGPTEKNGEYKYIAFRVVGFEYFRSFAPKLQG